ncbi:MAG: hypothetical protein ACR2JF_01425 [Iamia sp.]
MGQEDAQETVGGTDPPPVLADRPPPSMRSRRHALIVAAVMVTWISIQLVVPAVRLVQRGGEDRPRTFGWQMFSHQLSEPPEQFRITTRDGTREVAIEPLLTSPIRREVVYGPRIVAALCADPEVLSVEVRTVVRGTYSVSCR